MAENFNNNKNGGHANLSVPMTTFWSTDSSGNEYQSVKIGIYGEKITLNFTKGLKGNKEQAPDMQPIPESWIGGMDCDRTCYSEP